MRNLPSIITNKRRIAPLKVFPNLNLVLFPEDITNAFWGTIANVIANANVVADPNGNILADSLIETTVSGEHRIAGNLGTGYSGVVTLSAHIKNFSGSRKVQLEISNLATDGVSTIFDPLNSSTQISYLFSGADFSIISFGNYIAANGWSRYWITTSKVSSGTNLYPQIKFLTAVDVNTSTYLGDGTSGIYIWGIKLEQGTLTNYVG